MNGWSLVMGYEKIAVRLNSEEQYFLCIMWFGFLTVQYYCLSYYRHCQSWLRYARDYSNSPTLLATIIIFGRQIGILIVVAYIYVQINRTEISRIVIIVIIQHYTLHNLSLQLGDFFRHEAMACMHQMYDCGRGEKSM